MFAIELKLGEYDAIIEACLNANIALITDWVHVLYFWKTSDELLYYLIVLQ